MDHPQLYTYQKRYRKLKIMNYKKLIPSRKIRLLILKLFDFIPDKPIIQLQFFLSKGFFPNLKEPKKFTEKLQWYKLYYRKGLLTACSDKYKVRDYIKSKQLDHILVPIYGVYDCANKINFDSLPSQFVLKTNHGSHTNIICTDKSKLNIEKSRKNLQEWLTTWQGKVGREWSYYDIEPKIICEKYLEKDQNNDLVDYKFFCFSGKVFCLYVIIERFLSDGIKLGIYDRNFKKLPYKRSDIRDINKSIGKPKNFEKMIKIAETLSSDFPHVRVDLYNIDGMIFFGELTFYDGSGYEGFIPDKFDYILGKEFILPKI